ncbi:MAG: hypothetical protein GF308_18115 [Candidatus Heimdallarchaeota archaeon]|nr:hypothetical protein [Candidatus Heimdallarchaeota archaeon]
MFSTIAYCPIEVAFFVDWLFSQLHLDFPAITSEWALIEMFRAFKKQVNLETIAEKDADIALDYFLSDVGEMVKNKIVNLILVTQGLIKCKLQFKGFKLRLVSEYIRESPHSLFFHL